VFKLTRDGPASESEINFAKRFGAAVADARWIDNYNFELYKLVQLKTGEWTTVPTFVQWDGKGWRIRTVTTN
jgi:hypothetical protein